ncbi:hypothetical protein [Fibrobacter sp.]|uniref:hypothetical protein n=1 Tax=Fibrobacter sp. TaxID=35828 RepID=UPI0025BA5585|nr:hypothetical protein [Fibrobacter sp.]
MIKPKADFLHREKFKGRMQNPASFFVSRIVKSSKTCPHQMSAPQFSRKIQNAFNGLKTPIHKKNVSRKVKHLFPQNEETAKKAKKRQNQKTHIFRVK